jgi:hypothetical protein
MVGGPEMVFMVIGAFLGLVSLVVPVLGLYLLWQIKTSLTNVEKTLANLAQDRRSNK